jgi:cobalt/nickel transport system permease protein
LQLRPDRRPDPGDDSGRRLIVVRRNVLSLVTAGLVVAFLLATLASPFASSSPDGLEKVAADKALDTKVENHALAGGPLADYGVEGVGNQRVSTGLAGLIGVAVTFTVGFGVFAVIKRVRVEPEPGRGTRSAAAGP